MTGLVLGVGEPPIRRPPVALRWVRLRDTYLRLGLHACAAGAQLRLQTDRGT